MLEIKKAIRRALPMQIGFFGPSGSGKTFSALRFASGLSPNGKVVVVDTERGRASLYSDNKKILADLPNGFDVIEIDSPYHPKFCIEAIDMAEKGGYKTCIIDSQSDFWNGPGGCEDMAEEDKNMWNRAKLWNKRMTTRAALSDMHIIWCFKAQEKTKIIDKKKSESGKQEYVNMGIMPVCEKNNIYPLLLVFSVDPVTHLATATKCHDDLWALFPTAKLVTKDDGDRVRTWNESGKPIEKNEQTAKRAREAAQKGVASYKRFFADELTAAQRKGLVDDGSHEANKKIAEQADAVASTSDADEISAEEHAELNRLAEEQSR